MTPSAIKDVEVALFQRAIELRYGYDFSCYAQASLRRRIDEAVRRLGATRIADVIPRLVHEAELLPSVIHDLAVTVTEMFRDPPTFMVLRNEVIPVLRSFPRINIWIAGCATGEEVWSVAVLLHEASLLDRSRIYATDIDDIALGQAEEGVYPLLRLEQWRASYQASGGQGELSDLFQERYGLARIDDVLRRRVLFAHHNLATDGVFCEMHLILCRNVLNYFNRELQARVMGLFIESLCRGGYLCLGSKEGVAESDGAAALKPLGAGAAILRKMPA